MTLFFNEKSLPLKPASSGILPEHQSVNAHSPAHSSAFQFSLVFPGVRAAQYMWGCMEEMEPCDIYVPRCKDLKRGLRRLAWHLWVPGCQGGILY